MKAQALSLSLTILVPVNVNNHLTLTTSFSQSNLSLFLWILSSQFSRVSHSFISIFILFLWFPYWICSPFSLLCHYLLFHWITASKIQTCFATSSSQTKQKTLNPISPLASPPFCLLSYRTLTVYMVIPFSQFSVLNSRQHGCGNITRPNLLLLWWASISMHHYSFSLEFWAVKQTHLCPQSQYKTPSSALDILILSIL